MFTNTVTALSTMKKWIDEATLAQLEGESARDISKALMLLVIKRHPWRCVFGFGVPTAVAWALFGLGGFPVPLFMLSVGYFYFWSLGTQVFMERYAQRIGFVLDHTTHDPEDETGIVFHRGHTKNIAYRMVGTIASFRSALYVYGYTVGSGKHAKRYLTTVIDVQLPYALPRIYLDAQKDASIRAVLGSPHIEQLTLESNEFHRLFDLYVEDGAQVEALQVFTPDFMATLMDQEQHVDIEIAHGQMYLYQNASLTTSHLDMLISRATMVVGALSRTLSSLDRHRRALTR